VSGPSGTGGRAVHAVRALTGSAGVW